MRFRSCPLFLPALSLPIAVDAAWGEVSVEVTVNVDYSYTYSYSIENAGLFSVFSFALEFGLPASELDWDRRDVGSGGGVRVFTGDFNDPFDDWIARPGTPGSGQSAQCFDAVDPFGAGDIPPGGNLNGFSFTSFFPPALVNFHEFGPEGQVNSGQVHGPSRSVPLGPHESLRLLRFVHDGEIQELEFSSTPGRFYVVERSMDLELWHPHPRGVIAVSAQTTVLDVLTIVPDRLFYRVSIPD